MKGAFLIVLLMLTSLQVTFADGVIPKNFRGHWYTKIEDSAMVITITDKNVSGITSDGQSMSFSGVEFKSPKVVVAFENEKFHLAVQSSGQLLIEEIKTTFDKIQKSDERYKELVQESSKNLIDSKIITDKLDEKTYTQFFHQTINLNTNKPIESNLSMSYSKFLTFDNSSNKRVNIYMNRISFAHEGTQFKAKIEQFITDRKEYSSNPENEFAKSISKITFPTVHFREKNGVYTYNRSNRTYRGVLEIDTESEVFVKSSDMTFSMSGNAGTVYSYKFVNLKIGNKDYEVLVLSNKYDKKIDGKDIGFSTDTYYLPNYDLNNIDNIYAWGIKNFKKVIRTPEPVKGVESRKEMLEDKGLVELTNDELESLSLINPKHLESIVIDLSALNVDIEDKVRNKDFSNSKITDFVFNVNKLGLELQNRSIGEDIVIQKQDEGPMSLISFEANDVLPRNFLPARNLPVKKLNKFRFTAIEITGNVELSTYHSISLAQNKGSISLSISPDVKTLLDLKKILSDKALFLVNENSELIIRSIDLAKKIEQDKIVVKLRTVLNKLEGLAQDLTIDNNEFAQEKHSAILKLIEDTKKKIEEAKKLNR